MWCGSTRWWKTRSQPALKSWFAVAELPMAHSQPAPSSGPRSSKSPIENDHRAGRGIRACAYHAGLRHRGRGRTTRRRQQYGWSASWTRDVVAREVDAGTIWINDWAVVHDEFKEGGFK